MNHTTLKILIADDDRELAEILKRQFESRGYRDLVMASNGEEALVKTMELRPDLILLDVMMPILNGWEVCKQIKSNPELEGTRIIMLTGIGPSLNELTSPLYGADAYLDKPAEFPVIEREIDRLFPGDRR